MVTSKSKIKIPIMTEATMIVRVRLLMVSSLLSGVELVGYAYKDWEMTLINLCMYTGHLDV